TNWCLRPAARVRGSWPLRYLPLARPARSCTSAPPSFRVGAVVPPARPWGGSSGLFLASTSCTLGCCSARPFGGCVPTRRSVRTAAHIGRDLYLDLEAREDVPREEP